MYKTLEDLQNDLPLGSIVSEEPVRHRFYCASEVAMDKIKDYYGEENVKQVSPHHVVATNISIKTVDAYMTDGNYWYPMVRNGHLWEIYYPEVF